jgi:hypothetical protein
VTGTLYLGALTLVIPYMGKEILAVTDQEKKLQRAELLIEIEDAESDLNALREKAIRRQQALQKIASKLEMNAALLPSDDDFSVVAEVGRKLRLEDQEVLNFVEITKLIEELKQARQNVYNLHGRRKQLADSGRMKIVV